MLHHILRSLLHGMTEPQIRMYADGYYRRIVYRLGPYIADYPEQALLTCVVQGWCPKYVTYFSGTPYIDQYLRCTAHSKNLDDDPNALPRTQVHREAALEVYTPAEVWKTYGYIADVIVSKLWKHCGAADQTNSAIHSCFSRCQHP
jgi:hypothetical protein